MYDTVLQAVNEEPVPPRQLNAQVPRDLETVALKCLRKEPAGRYADAEEAWRTTCGGGWRASRSSATGGGGRAGHPLGRPPAGGGGALGGGSRWAPVG
ncbi:MAG: hypothetical protein U0797_05060 [Gemmataceae bacterium]